MSNYTYLTATGNVKIGAGKLKSVVVSSGTNPTVALYDTDVKSTSGTNITGTMTFATTPQALQFGTGDTSGAYFNKGLYVVLGGTNPVVTIIWE